MTPHAPKTAALEALAADLLSDEGTRRIRAHLRACETCRGHFATIHVYRESQELIAAAEPKVDWSKMELALAREARTQAAENLKTAPARSMSRGAAANDGRYPWLLGGAIAVAAAALAAIGLSNGWFGRNTPAPEHAPVVAVVGHTPDDAVEPVAVAQPASGTISMIAGGASFASDFADSATETLAVGQRIQRGVVMTGPLGHAAFELEGPPSSDAPDAAPVTLAHVTLGADAQLSVGEVMLGEPIAPTTQETIASTVTSRLARGRTTIDAFETSSRVVVLAGSYRVEIRAARCTIELDAPTNDDDDETARVRVSATHGDLAAVVVVDPEGHRTELTADGGAWASRALADAPELVDLPLALAEGPLVQISFPDAVRFEVGEVSVAGGPDLAMRVPVGALDIRAFDRSGRAFRAHVNVGPEGLALSPDQLEPVRARIVGFLPPEDITPIVQRSQRALQRCYEQAMRQHPEIGGGLMRARVTLDSHGAVRVVEIQGDSVPPSLEQCVRTEAATWSFPSPGGPMSFELPLRFRTRQ